MVKAKLYNQIGEEAGETNLNPKIFSVAVKSVLVHQAIVAFLANRRTVVAHTKGKGEVRGGGKKPWKQKGTGRARHGSSRSPLWRGGGITFGPTSERNYAKKLNKKMRKKALFMVLSDKAADHSISALEKLDWKESKTKAAESLLQKMGLSDKKVLFVIEKMDRKIAGAFRNLPKADVIAANSLNVYDALNSNKLVFTKAALKALEAVFLKGSAEAK
ncbi:MAG: 50S ribosomal protein L4 [Parcubacteria group bacterium]